LDGLAPLQDPHYLVNWRAAEIEGVNRDRLAPSSLVKISVRLAVDRAGRAKSRITAKTA
jgi:hypothetical protein